MANLRELKKDIDYLVFEVISDCLTFSGVHPDKHSNDVEKIITDAVDLRNDLFARVNNPDGKDNPKLVRAYYQAVKKDLFEGVDKLFDRLSSLSGK
jgi:hypothetical protein